MRLLALTIAALSVPGCASHHSGPQSARPPAAEWSVPPNQPDAARIEFAFPPPHDTYAGEIRRATGVLSVSRDLARVTGHFAVHIADLDMGEADLTRSVQTTAEMLRAGDFPTASFTVHRIEGSERLLHFLSRRSPSTGRSSVPGGADGLLAKRPGGGSVSAALIGEFELKGVTSPLTIPIVCELHGGDQASGSRPTVTMSGDFTIENLDSRYGIARPAPDDPAADRVVVEFRFELSPRAP